MAQGLDDPDKGEEILTAGLREIHTIKKDIIITRTEGIARRRKLEAYHGSNITTTYFFNFLALIGMQLNKTGGAQ